MSIAPREVDEDKRCFAYCGDDLCRCGANPMILGRAAWLAISAANPGSPYMVGFPADHRLDEANASKPAARPGMT